MTSLIHLFTWWFSIMLTEMQVKKYYQPRKSHRTVLVDIEGTKVPLYGAGSSLVVANNGSVQIPLTLRFEIRSRGDVVGKLVRTKHRKPVSCSLVIDSMGNKPVKFKKDSCVYNWGSFSRTAASFQKEFKLVFWLCNFLHFLEDGISILMYYGEKKR